MADHDHAQYLTLTRHKNIAQSSKHFPRITWRTTDRGGGVFYDGTYIVGATRSSAATSIVQITSWEQFGYGTYEWYGKITTPTAGRFQYIGWGEEFAAQYEDSIFLLNNGSHYRLQNSKGGIITSADPTGQDWTTEKKFKIAWSPGSVAFYVDDALLAIHTTNVPNKSLVKFIELVHTARQTSHSYIYVREHF